GDTLKQDNDTNQYGPLAGYRANTGGVVTGVDALFAEFFYTGVLGGYTHSHLHYEDGKGTGDIASGYAGSYFSILGPQIFD
ncbi:autotransporter domain-containing protein, partial [Vibrio parahaemolyticus]|uniref:autotransporter domain-containing protein n=1 Tax=Vibrio parahaemolyticus TaxID=670 RepID=UPI001A8CC272